MAVYFVQHGLALSKDLDADRPLSVEGLQQVECVSTHLKKIGITVNKVCHSGKTRAMETAQIFAAEIGNGNISDYLGLTLMMMSRRLQQL